MKRKNRALFLAAVLLAYALFGCGLFAETPPQPAEDEIMLFIQLDVREDIGMLLYRYSANGEEHTGGTVNADKSLLKHDERIIDTWKKEYFKDPSDVENLTVWFTVVTEYFEPNYENLYPEEAMAPLDPISWKADFGQSYRITISGDRANGYRAVLEEEPKT